MEKSKEVKHIWHEQYFAAVDYVYVAGPFESPEQVEKHLNKCFIKEIECFQFNLEGEDFLIPGPDIQIMSEPIIEIIEN